VVMREWFMHHLLTASSCNKTTRSVLWFEPLYFFPIDLGMGISRFGDLEDG
jgi:hypothetical protein